MHAHLSNLQIVLVQLSAPDVKLQVSVSYKLSRMKLVKLSQNT